MWRVHLINMNFSAIWLKDWGYLEIINFKLINRCVRIALLGRLNINADLPPSLLYTST